MPLTMRRGASRRRMMVAAASGSVGETIAPRTKAAAQGRPGTRACAATATAHTVASTSPTVARVSPRRLARRSLKFAKIDAPYRSGGRKTTSTTSGSSFTSGSPGTNPNRAPPTTSTIGYGTDRWRASALRPTTATSSPAIRSSAWPTPQVCPPALVLALRKAGRKDRPGKGGRMQIDEIRRVLIVGCGTMGQQIGFQCAGHGYGVVLYDVAPQALESARERIDDYAGGLVADGVMSAELRD